MQRISLLLNWPVVYGATCKFQNGSVNALVYVAMSFALTGAGYLSDLIEKRQLMSKCASRKLFETVALIGPAVSMALIPTSGDNKQLVIGLLVIGMTLYGFYGGGDNPIVVDIAPDFSGSVYGLTCAIGSIPGFVAPVFVGFLLDLDVRHAALSLYFASHLTIACLLFRPSARQRDDVGLRFLRDGLNLRGWRARVRSFRFGETAALGTRGAGRRRVAKSTGCRLSPERLQIVSKFD